MTSAMHVWQAIHVPVVSQPQALTVCVKRTHLQLIDIYQVPFHIPFNILHFISNLKQVCFWLNTSESLMNHSGDYWGLVKARV